MSVCFLIGDTDSDMPSYIARHLSGDGIPSKAFRPAKNSNHDKLFEVCAAEKDLKLIAVFLDGSLHKNVSAFFRSLRESVGGNIRIHVFFPESSKKGNELLPAASREFVDGATGIFALGADRVARLIRTHWFSDKEKPNEAYVAGAGGSVKWNHIDQQSSASSDSGGDTAVMEKPAIAGESVGAMPMPKKVLSLVPPVTKPATPINPLASISKGNKAIEDKLELLLKNVKKNTPLPVEPVVVNIVGKAGTAVELDPRRVRPLPQQPRHRDSPGFTEESLSELGENMRMFGQLEEAMVCPIVGDPQYDAQLIDAERRHGGCLRAKIMLRATVREDVTPEMVLELFLLSVVRNSGKEPHTSVEYVSMVQRFLGPEYGMTQKQVAKIFNCSINWVVQYAALGTLHPDVLAMVGEARDNKLKEGNKDTEEKRKITLQLAQLLVPLPKERQLTDAQHIISQSMNYNQARRYILKVRRGAGIEKPRRGWRSEAFRALQTLTTRSIDAFGITGDMTDVEILSLLANQKGSDIQKLLQDLQTLTDNLSALSKRIDAGVKQK